jgi:hypothetical protein
VCGGRKEVAGRSNGRQVSRWKSKGEQNPEEKEGGGEDLPLPVQEKNNNRKGVSTVL